MLNAVTQPPRRPRGWVRRTAALAGVIAALLAVGYVTATRRLTAAVHASLREASTRLGRPLTVRDVRVCLLPTLDITLTGLTLGPARDAAGEARRPLVEVASVRVRVPLLPLLRAGGADLRVESLSLHEPAVTVMILAGGRSSFDDLRQRPAPPAGGRGLLRALRNGRATIDRGSLRVVDVSDGHPATAALQRLDVSVRDLGPDRDATAHLTAALFGASPNLQAMVSLGRLRVGGDGTPITPAVSRVAARFDDVTLAPALRVVSKHRQMRLLAATVRGDVAVALDGGRPSRVTASLRARGLVLRRRTGGEHPAVDARADADVSLRPDGLIDVTHLEVALDGMSLGGSAQVARVDGVPTLRALAFASRDISLERLEPWLPAGTVPRGAALTGPLRFTASGRREAGGGADVDVSLDLADATVELPDTLHKPAGTALSARFTGRVRGRDVRVERLGFILGPLRAHLRGEVQSAERFDLSIDTGEVPLDPLLRLLPIVRGRVPPGVTLHGRLRASGEVRTAGSAHRIRARVALRGANASTETLALAGDADATLDATLDGRDLDGSLRIDATAARVTVPGRIDKVVGAPMILAARGRRRAHRVELTAADVVFPGAHLEGSARWDERTRRGELTVPVCELDVARLLPALPAASSRVPRALASASLRASVSAQGDPDAPSSAHARVEGLVLRTPHGQLRGSVDATGLDAPRRVRFDLWGDVIDLDPFLPAPSREADGSPGTPAWLRDADLEGSLRADVLRVRDVSLASPRASLQLRGGTLTFPTLSFGAMGGRVQGDGTAVDLVTPSRRVSARIRAERIDLFLLGAALGTELDRRATGSLDVTARLTAEGRDAAAMRASANGRLRLEGINVVARRLVQPQIAVSLPIVGTRTIGRARRRDPTQPLALQRFDAPLRLEGGAVETAGPIVVESDMGSIRLTGRVDADGVIALGGQISIPPEVIDRATNGSLLPRGPVPVAIRVAGTTDAPRVEVGDLGSALGALLGSGLRALGREISR